MIRYMLAVTMLLASSFAASAQSQLTEWFGVRFLCRSAYCQQLLAAQHHCTHDNHCPADLRQRQWHVVLEVCYADENCRTGYELGEEVVRRGRTTLRPGDVATCLDHDPCKQGYRLANPPPVQTAQPDKS